jgi:hypothetical protein
MNQCLDAGNHDWFAIFGSLLLALSQDFKFIRQWDLTLTGFALCLLAQVVTSP